jgi:hypothetical protein
MKSKEVTTESKNIWTFRFTSLIDTGRLMKNGHNVAVIFDKKQGEEMVKALNTHDDLVKALEDLTKYTDNLLNAPNRGNNDFVSKVAYLFNDLSYYNNVAKEALKKATA